MRRFLLLSGVMAMIAGAAVACFSERTVAVVDEGECRFPVDVDVPGSTIVVIRRFTFQPGEVRVRAGERVRLRLDASRMAFLDGDPAPGPPPAVVGGDSTHAGRGAIRRRAQRRTP